MPKQPNIVIFNPDHMRGDVLGHVGNPAAVTPNLDRVVQTDGVSFSSAFCQSPVCTPSRCSFMSGWYPHVRGHRTMFHMMHPDEPVLLRNLKDNGYLVWWGGKNDLVPGQDGYEPFCHVRHRGEGRWLKQMDPEEKWRGDPDKPGFYSFYYGKIDTGDEDVFYDSDWDNITAAVKFIKSKPKGPFCLYLALMLPHPPYAVEDPWYSMIDRSKVPPRKAEPEDWSGKPTILQEMYKRYNLGSWSEEQWTELRATEYGMCARLDHQYGLLMEALQEAGLYDDTAVFFFSDHGDYIGDYGVVDINQNTFEDSLTRVPFVFKPPASVPVKPGVRDCLVELTDFSATVEEMTGIGATHTHFGKSLLPVVSGETNEHRDTVFSEGGRIHGEEHCMELEYEPAHKDVRDFYWPRVGLQPREGPEHTKGVMCRTRDFKYVRRLYESDELYDLREDPDERVNRIDDPALAGVLADKKDRMLSFFLDTVDVVPFETDKRH